MADAPSALPDQPAPASNGPDKANNAVVVKKYANRRLYNTETSSYITLENLAEMIRAGRDFVVYDAKSGDDITRGVLTQIIVEEESKGSAMLPTAFLRQLIGFYGGNLQGVVPRYLEYTMSSFAQQQQQVRTAMERTFSPFLPSGVEELNRHNMQLFERAISMWNPFVRPSEPANTSEPTATGSNATGPSDDEIAAGVAAQANHAELTWLRGEVEALRRQLAAAHADAVVPAAAPAMPAKMAENVRRDPAPEPDPAGRSARRTIRGKSEFDTSVG